MIENNFGHLVSNLRSSKKLGNSDFDRKLFTRLSFGNYRSWIEANFSHKTRLIIEPKICGPLIALKYKNGILHSAIDKDGFDKTSLLLLVRNLPKKIPISKTIRILGKIYSFKNDLDSSNTLSSKYLEQENLRSQTIGFIGFQIFDADLNHYSQLKVLKNLGFLVPPNKFTRFSTNEIELYIHLWLKKRLFYELPSDGIVIKVNSRKLQKRLGESNQFLNWAFAIKLN